MTQSADIEALSREPDIRALDLGVFDRNDLINLILQRSEILYDHPQAGQVIRSWTAGNSAPITQVADDLGVEIAYRTAGVIRYEFDALVSVLGPAPGRVADIGCGYGFFDLFLARETGASVLLIDLEQNEHRRFGFSKEGAAYSSLTTARKLLETNGVASADITTLNPSTKPVESASAVDLAVSFLSCGFHFPVESYMPFFRDVVTPDGRIILDLRPATEASQRAQLKSLGSVRMISQRGKAKRVLVDKSGGLDG